METQLHQSLMRLNKLKKYLIGASFLFLTGLMFSQQAYDNFEGTSVVCYNAKKGGTLDTLAANPSPDKVNGSEKCAKYTRSKSRYDNIKMCTKSKLGDLSSYATYLGQPQKIKMKVYTTAPVGTLVEIHLQKKAGNAYPEGTHSQYQAYTTVSGAWEELEFKYAQTPPGSQTTAEEVEQITLLFAPNTANKGEVFYFDDITGPGLTTTSVTKEEVKETGTK